MERKNNPKPPTLKTIIIIKSFIYKIISIILTIKSSTPKPPENARFS